jgi:hypothetical protein
MTNIQERYKICASSNSDINEHLPALHALATEVEKITEFGTRDGDSTTAFLAAIENTNKTLTCYDLYKSSNTLIFEQFKNFKFNNTDTLQVTIEETDLLFIDTLHTYFQLYNELGLHSKKVSTYIALHDTTTYGIEDEPLYQPGFTVKMSEKANIRTPKTGLKNAITDFLQTTKDGANWFIFKEYTNNNGLTILKRK